MTTRPKLKAVPDTDPLADRPRWQRVEFLPKLQTIRWERLDSFRERHVAAVTDLRAAVEADDPAAEEKILDAVGDVVALACRVLWEWFPVDGEEAFQRAAAAVTVKPPAGDGAELAPRPASADGSGDLIDAYNQRADAFAERQRRETAELAPARAAFDRDAGLWRRLHLQLEPTFLRGSGAVSADVVAVEKHREGKGS